MTILRPTPAPQRLSGAALTGGLAVALLVVAAASLFLGSHRLGIGEVWAQLLDGPVASGAADSATDSEANHILWQLRLPRTVLAVTAGANVAVAGAITQTLTRNPLADPGFIGITAGAAFAVAIAIAAGSTLGALGVTTLAMLGAAAATALVFLLARVAPDATTLVLAGVGITACLQAVTTLLSLNATAVLDGLRQWTVGSTFGRGYTEVGIAAAGLVLGMGVALLCARGLDLLAMGETTAIALGSSPSRTRSLAALAVIVLAGTATAAVGPVAFVGFAAPNAIRLVLGPDVRTTVVPTALLGSALTLLADILGRLVLYPGELEMSIILAVVGAPLLMWVVRKAPA
ncbi:iron ABC transporter permease [Corynebacterium incognita]|uniref:Iron ABC transporter permease n=1 Tax=Corynebacterium incognita TaxID=2754725 RepID=A0A7G7CMN5_9CORY|nr:iron ABC transporter permease [Corynebacterium incognita]QNE88851.1 iron ABC transporter permease [Corynebacterium incognita]